MSKKDTEEQEPKLIVDGPFYLSPESPPTHDLKVQVVRNCHDTVFLEYIQQSDGEKINGHTLKKEEARHFARWLRDSGYLD